MTTKDYFENMRSGRMIFRKEKGANNILNKPAFYLLISEDFKTGKNEYAVILKKGIDDYFITPMVAFYEGKKNIHYKVFKSKKKANEYIESNINN